MLSFASRRFFPLQLRQLNNRNSSSLAKLRKSTGYSISNCKKAIGLFPDDVAKAEEWLHVEAKKQGWSKWAKIQSRSASQGLVGVFSRDKIGVMVEVNCETDFVGKNVEFQQLVEDIMNGCLNHITEHSITEDVTKTFLNEAQLNGIQHGSSTLGELVNAAVNRFNEKTVLKRAICVKVKEDISLSSLSHPAISCPSMSGATLGKYGTLLAYKHNSTEDVNEKELSASICQHIIGMNPTEIGHLTENDILNFKKEDISGDTIEIVEQEIPNVKTQELSEAPTDQENPKTEDQDNPETEGQDTVSVDVKDSDDTRLLFQSYLLDPNVTVGETVHKSGLEIVDFERFECGENLVENDEAKQSASAAI